MSTAPHRTALLLLVALALPAARARADDLPAWVADEVAALVHDLEAVASWAKTRRCFGKQDETLELVLRWAPDHREARARLGFERGDDGTWVQDPRYERPRNWDRGALKHYGERLAAAWTAHRDRLVARGRVVTAPADLDALADLEARLLEVLPEDPDLRRSLRDVLLARLVALPADAPIALRRRVEDRLRTACPDDAEARAALGDVELDGRWVLEETARGAARRAELAAVAAAALASTSPETADLSPEERAVLVAWTGAASTPHARVAGTATAESLAAAASAVEASAPLFAAAFGRPEPERGTLRVWIFAQEREWVRFRDECPLLSEDLRAWATAQTLKGFALGARAYVVREVTTAEVEREMAALAAFDQLLTEALATERSPQLRGWCYEGVSRYLTFRLVGTRLTVTTGGRYGSTAGDLAPRDESAWLEKTRDAFRGGEGPDLHLLLGKYVDAFTPEDAFAAYSLTAFLVEGNPQQAWAFLARTAHETDVDGACREVLGAPLEVVTDRFRRWLEETTAGPAAPAAPTDPE